MEYEELWHRLTHIYDAGEAKAIVRWVLDVRFDMSWTDILCGKVTELSAYDQTELVKIVQRLEKGEPVQYIIGVADFCGRQFHVEPGVLIPRPETEELCRMVIEEREISQKGQSPLCEILDIGTGSGCIAITLALELPDAKVTAWDISDDALRIAGGNAKSLGANVTFEHCDVLDSSLFTPDSSLFTPDSSLFTLHSSLFTLHSSLPSWDLIVSNPPYIQPIECDEMAKNVLDYEPQIALFAPEDNPIVFYQRIGDYAWQHLNPGGLLFFELNPLTADQVCDTLRTTGFMEIEIRKDQFGKNRFLKAMKI
jgi:release factor glutamine methyltransferase